MTSVYSISTEQQNRNVIRQKKTQNNHVKDKSVLGWCLLLFNFLTVEAKDAEVKKLLKKKDVDLEEMKKRLKDQERERQSELLKLQMEVT